MKNKGNKVLPTLAILGVLDVIIVAVWGVSDLGSCGYILLFLIDWVPGAEIWAPMCGVLCAILTAVIRFSVIIFIVDQLIKRIKKIINKRPDEDETEINKNNVTNERYINWWEIALLGIGISILSSILNHYILPYFLGIIDNLSITVMVEVVFPTMSSAGLVLLILSAILAIYTIICKLLFSKDIKLSKKKFAIFIAIFTVIFTVLIIIQIAFVNLYTVKYTCVKNEWSSFSEEIRESSLESESLVEKIRFLRRMESGFFDEKEPSQIISAMKNYVENSDVNKLSEHNKYEYYSIRNILDKCKIDYKQ